MNQISNQIEWGEAVERRRAELAADGFSDFKALATTLSELSRRSAPPRRDPVNADGRRNAHRGQKELVPA